MRRTLVFVYWTCSDPVASVVNARESTLFAMADKFHTRATPFSDPDRARCPSGLHATLQTLAVWPSRTRTQRPNSSSHSRTVLSSDPDRARCPSGLHATLTTLSVWPSRTRTQRPDSSSHSRTVLSSD